MRRRYTAFVGRWRESIAAGAAHEYEAANGRRPLAAERRALSLGVGMHHPAGPSLLSRLTFRARAHRRAPTPSEAKLWNALRMSKLGVRFRRQHPLAPYVVDFYCVSSRLVVEVDGGYHLEPAQVAEDAHRSRELVRLHGVRILRVRSELVMSNIAAVCAVIRAAL